MIARVERVITQNTEVLGNTSQYLPLAGCGAVVLRPKMPLLTKHQKWHFSLFCILILVILNTGYNIICFCAFNE